MKLAIAEIEAGQAPDAALDTLKRVLMESGFGSVDYAALADASSLELLDSTPHAPARLLVAARIGKTRLIDNMAVQPAV